MRSYRELEIYRESKTLAIRIHKMTLALPKFELFEEGSQLRRSSKAITSLIVEGYGRRRFKKEFVKYLVYCQAECDEMLVHLDFVFECQSFTDKEEYVALRNEYDTLSRRINCFLQWVERNEVIR